METQPSEVQGSEVTEKEAELETKLVHTVNFEELF